MRVWPTGGSGFAGGHLVEAFDDVLWEGPNINMVATPTLASDAAGLIARIAEALPGVDEQLRRLERSLACTT